VQAPASLPADTPFNVDWTGPNNQGDYISILPAGATEWINEAYFYTYVGTPGQMVAPTTPGNYKVVYIDGTSRNFKAQQPMTVTAFEGSVSGPASVAAGTVFSASWTGPNALGDYITIVAKGATQWTDESWFYTANGSPGNLAAPLVAGEHELWYVASDRTVMTRTPITVLPLAASVTVATSANKGASISVGWTGPNAPGDYITIVAAGAAEGSYLSYAYTGAGNPVNITAPDTAGAYEIRYVYGSNGQTLVSQAIQIK
jgi:Ca-activated chloride channel family protein